MTSICWIHPTTKATVLQPLFHRLSTIVGPIVRPDVKLEQRFLADSGNFTRSLYAEHLNSVHMVEAALQAQNDGFDGVCSVAGTTRCGRHAKSSISRSPPSVSNHCWLP